MRCRMLLCLILAFLGVTAGCEKRGPRRPPDTLHDAVWRENVAEVRSLLARGADANVRDNHGQTPLHLAVSWRSVDMAELLLDAGADINARDKSNQTALHEAAEWGYEAVVQLLIRRGADLNVTDENGDSPLDLATDRNRLRIAEMLAQAGAQMTLHTAAYVGDVEAIERLGTGRDDLDKADRWGVKPLHMAARGGRKEMVAFLLSRHVDVNARARSTWGNKATPLHFAASCGDLDVVRILIANGAELGAVDDDGDTPLHWAAEAGRIEAVRLLITEGADLDVRNAEDRSPLLVAFWEGHTDVGECLLAAGAPVRPEKDRSLLALAARCGYKALVERLIAAGGDVNAGASAWALRKTALCEAVAGGHKDVAELLIRHGADVNAGDLWGSWPLLAAVCNAETDMVELLITNGADADVRDRSGETPLHIVTRKGDKGAAELLLAHGADADARDVAGNTPLHLAAQKAYSDMAEVLIANAADVNAKNHGGTTPLHCAVSEGHKQVALLLLANSADVNARDRDGDTPLHTAAVRGHAEMVSLLLSCGADIAAKDTSGAMPVDEARRRRHPDVADLLENAGHQPRIVAPGRQSPTPSGTPQARTPVTASVPTVVKTLDDLRVEPVALSDAALARRHAKRLAQDNAAFAVDLYRQLSGGEGNTFFSPYSISTALAMTYAGARGNTASEMAQTLHFSLDHERLHPAFAGLRGALGEIEDSDQIQLRTANSIWPQEGHVLLPEYVSLIKRHYGVTITSVDYTTETAREETRRVINAWVEQQTQDRIKELLKPAHLDAATRLVLTNAIYFKGNWQHQFDPNDTEEAPFHITPAISVPVKMMTQTDDMGYAENEDLQIVELTYRGGRLSMLVLLPKQRDGLRQIEQSLSVESLGLWRHSIVKREVVIFLPRFTMTCGIELKSTLQSMGMVEAFRWPGANFAGFDGDPTWFFIGEVVHKAFVNVNEEGTEAAAATAVVMNFGGVPAPPPVFRADHPFLFLIQENRTGSILFMGRLVDPTRAG